MTDVHPLIPTRSSMPVIVGGATAYAPLPTDPFEEHAPALFAAPRPRPVPSPPPPGPAYPSLPVEPDTRDGGGSRETK